MSSRILEVTAEDHFTPRIRQVCRTHGADDVLIGALGQDGRRMTRVVCGILDRQGLLDALQAMLVTSATWRIVVVPVEATLPILEEDRDDTEKSRRKQRMGGLAREELSERMRGDARPDRNFFLLVAMSSIVCAIGLIEDSIAVVIGAMVIAPLLAPNLALAFASAVGDIRLISRAVLANAAGVATTLAVGLATALIFPTTLNSEALLQRTEVGLDSLAVALAAGAAAAMSLTTGVSAVLVGVMVAVALLPPASAAGIMLGWGEWGLAGEAFLLLGVNLVCVNLSAQCIFLMQGIRPRDWFEAERAKRAVRFNTVVWVALLAVLAGVLYFRGWVLTPGD